VKKGKISKEEYLADQRGGATRLRWRAIRAHFSDQPEAAARFCLQHGPCPEIIFTGLDFNDPDWYNEFFAEYFRRA